MLVRVATGAGWERLTRMLEDDDAVVAAVIGALERGEDPWEALLDGLDEAGALAYLQSDDTGMELSDALAQLPRVFRSGCDLDEVADVDELELAVEAADLVLSERGLRILRLPEDDDTWPLVVVPQPLVPAVLEEAGALGRLVRRFR